MSSASLASSISKMFSGTLVSRILGQVRLIVLVAALGTTLQADAFMVANTLPNTIYNLLAGGVLNAILVPQIVRAMKRPDGDVYINRLLTVSGTLLFGATVILTAGAGLLVTLYASRMAPEWFALAVAFAFWCIPQVFFYGLYTLLGNVLNARGSFGPYMWAPVVNNVVAIAGLLAYIWVFGPASSGSGTDPADWTSSRIAMVGGFATLGVICQALVLVIPLRRSGFRFRPTWGLRGSGLGGASRMAMWTFGALAVGQLGYLMLTNVASSANGAAAAADVFVPTNTAYAAAFSIFMLPQSLITTSLVTALFTRMATHAAARDGAAVRTDMSFGVRVVGVFTVFAAAALCVLAIPVVQAVIPTADAASAVGFAAVLVALSLGIPAQGIWTIDQRVSYAYEDARTLFRIQVPMAAVIIVGGFLSFLAPPQWWVPIVSGASSLSLYLGAVVGFLALRTKLPSLDGARVLRTYVRLGIAVAPAVAVGWTLLHFWGPVSEADGAGLGPFLAAVVKVLAIGSLMAAIYLGVLRRIGVDELDEILAPVLRLLRRRRTPAPPTSGHVPTMDADGDAGGRGPGVLSVTTGSLLAGRFRLDEAAPGAGGVRLGTGRDRVLDRPIAILLVDSDAADEVIDAARRASLIDDNRFARVIDAGRDPSGVAYVVSEQPAGTTIDRLAGLVDVATARAIVGEAAAALEAARRRGVHHGALDPSRVVVTADGGVVITGLGFLAVAEGLVPEQEDPVESSLARSRADAGELERLLGYLETGTPPETATARANAGEVMRSLAPWGEITLPGTGARTSIPPWQRVAGHASASRALPVVDPTAESTAVPPPPPPPDTSRWAPRRTGTSDGALPGFEDLLDEARSDTSATSPATAPTHAAVLPPPWKVLLPAAAGSPATPPESAESPPDSEELPAPAAPEAEFEMRRAAAGLKDSAARASAAAAVHAAWHSARSEEAPPQDVASEPEDVASEPEESPSEEIAADRGTGAALAAAAAAARTASEKIRVGGTHVMEHAGRAKSATVKAAGASLAKLDTFVAKHDIHVPGELESQENAELPFSERRLDPGPFVLVLVVAAVAVATILAVLNLMTIGGGDSATEPTATATATAPTAAESVATPDEEGAPVEPVVVPVVASIGVLDPQGDGGENPDLAGRAIDGDTTTYWRSRSYVNPAYGMKQGIGLDLALTEPALVTEVTLTLMGTGGHVQVKADPADPVNGAVLVEADMSPTTVLTLPEPTELSHVVLWFTSLPVADSDGKNRVELAEVTVR